MIVVMFEGLPEIVVHTKLILRQAHYYHIQDKISKGYAN